MRRIIRFSRLRRYPSRWVRGRIMRRYIKRFRR